MQQRSQVSCGTASFWLGMVSVVVAFMPIAVAFFSHTDGFSDRVLESALSFIVPALVALAALGLGVVELVRAKQTRRLAILGAAFSVIALVGCGLTFNGFLQVFGFGQ